MILGVIFLIFGLIFWLGQTIVLFSPTFASKLGLVEKESEVDKTFFIIESKAIPLVDFLLAWTFPLAAYLMITKNDLWPIWGLIGGGIFAYSSLHIVYSRIALKNKNVKTGPAISTNSAYIFGTLWFLMGVLMIIFSCKNLNIF